METHIPPRVFISYSHDSPEHKARVRDLAHDLRRDGINAWIDQYEVSPRQGWPRWVVDQFDRADFVMFVCTEGYRKRFEGREEPGTGRGVTWEGFLAHNRLYRDAGATREFIAVRFDDTADSVIPGVLEDSRHYVLGAEYTALLRQLSNQPPVEPPPLGHDDTANADALRAALPVPQSIEKGMDKPPVQDPVTWRRYHESAEVLPPHRTL